MNTPSLPASSATHPETIPAPPPAAATNAATHPTTGPTAIATRPLLDPQALLRACIEEAGLDGDDMRDLKVIAKFAAGEAVWAVGQKAPGREELYIVALFDGGAADLNEAYVPGDVRAYVMSLGATSPTEKQWFCYTLSRARPEASHAAIMTQDRFIQEVSLELGAQAGIRDAVAEENEALRTALEAIIAKAEETVVPAVTRIVAIADIAAEALADEEEEDGE